MTLDATLVKTPPGNIESLSTNSPELIIDNDLVKF